ncbi:MAG: hypothetical protein AAF628_23380 [Planctomycetota bacterium]
MSVLFGFFEVLSVMFAVILGLPFLYGVPPLPEDPALLRAAPADSVAYVQWFGTAAAEGTAPTSRTERLLAEPGVQRLLQRVRGAVRDQLFEEFDHPLAPAVAGLVETLLQRPGCAFVTLTEADFGGGMVVALGERGDEVTTLLRRLEGALIELMGDQAAPLAAPQSVAMGFRALPTLPDTPPVAWRVRDGYLAVAVGEGVASQIAAGLAGEPGLAGRAALQRVHEAVRVARPMFRSFLDLERLLQFARAHSMPHQQYTMDAAGLRGVQALISETGLEGPHCVSRTMLGLTEGRARAVAALTGRPLDPAVLGIVPGDATCAAAARLDPLLLLRGLRELLEVVDPREFAELDRGIDEFEEHTGLDLRRDVLAPLGDVVAAWSAPSQGGALMFGPTAALTIDDAEAFGRAFATIMKTLEGNASQRPETGRIPRDVYLERTTWGDREVWYLNPIGDFMPFAPAWCVTDTHLLLALYPQQIFATLDRGVDGATSLGARPELAGRRGSMLGWLDSEAMVGTGFPLAMAIGALVFSDLQRDGFDLDLAALPPLTSLTPHLGVEVATLEATPRGVMVARQGSLPLADPLMVMALPAAAWLGWSRSAAMRQLQELRRRGNRREAK